MTAELAGGASGDLVLTGTNGTASVTVTATGTDGTALGLPPGANSAEPVNLLTQGAVAQGDTMTITVGNGAPQTITFGTNAGAGQVATLAELQTAIGGISGLTGTVNTANGDVTLTSNSQIVLDSTPDGTVVGIRHPQRRRLSGQRHGDRQRRNDFHQPIGRWRLHHRL